MKTASTTVQSDMETLGEEELLALRRRVDEALERLGVAPPAPSDDTQPLTNSSHACRLFTVSDGVRSLDKGQLEALTKTFEAWVEAARGSRTRRSRERVFLAYLLLRYTGAKLGEVLTLDERKHIDYFRAEVTFPIGEDPAQGRVVPLPSEVIQRIRAYCLRHEDAQKGPREPLFDLDPGFLRRKFYEQSEASGLPRDLLNPRVLRNSRAIELLRGGMPMRAVQSLLGHSKTDFTSAYVELAEGDLRRIVHQHCRKEFSMETSARNTFTGKVVAVTTNPVVCEVVLKTDSGNEIVAVITNGSRVKLGIEEGRHITALVKAPFVILEKAETPALTSARNAFLGTITEILSDGVVAEVDGVLRDGTPVCAIVTEGSFQKLGIGVGDNFIYMFKAMSVILT
ncbi:MAG: TOBE domain-containing protein [Desulfovibrionaceae bacterium]